MVSFKGQHRTKRYFLKHKLMPKLAALGEYFIGPLPA